MVNSSSILGFTICKFNNDMVIYYQVDAGIYSGYLNEDSKFLNYFSFFFGIIIIKILISRYN